MSWDENSVWYRTGLDFFGSDSRRVRLQLYEGAKSEFAKGKTIMLFDGTNIYSLGEPLVENKRVTVKLGKKTADIATMESKKMGTLAEVSNEHTTLMNIVFRKALDATGLKRIFTDYYDVQKPVQIDDERVRRSVNIFPGLTSEISQRMLGGKPQFCLSLDPTHKVVSLEFVLDLMKDLRWNQEKIMRALRGKRVTTVYNFKTYGVEGIDWKMSPKSTFKRTNRRTGEEETISFVEYMKETGNPVKDLNQPLIISTGRMRERIHLLPEFCVPALVPGLAKAKLPQITSIKPADRLARIDSLIKLVTAAGEKKAASVLAMYGLEVKAKPLAVKSTVLPPAHVVFAPGKEFAPSGEWRREAGNVRFSNVTTKKKLQTLLIYDTTSDFAPKYWGMIRKKLAELQAPLAFEQDKVFAYDGSKFSGDYAKIYASAAELLPKNIAPKDVLVVAFMTSDKRRSTVEYDSYREFTLEQGFVGQAIDASEDGKRRKMDNRNLDSIVTNLARQIVNKYGFQSWWMTMSKTLPAHSSKQFLFVGIDVFHAPPVLVRDPKAPGDSFWQKRSIAAFTAKLIIGGTSSHFFCSTEVRDAGAEITGQKTQSVHASSSVEVPGASLLKDKVINPAESPLGAFVQNALKHWETVIKPEALVLIVYRDGVAESQLDLVDKAEVAQIKEVVHEKTHVIYSVVQKRVHNRFVMSDGPKAGNCNPGTVVEELCLSGPRTNFYMVPCATNLSTNKPVHYTICYDSHPGVIKPTEFYAVTFAAHHTYQNWAGTVKVPDVCQYAHKLAYTLGECNVRRPVVPALLQDTMFYL